MFSQVGPLEIILVLAIALIVLGPKRLPGAARSVGKGLREFKNSLSDVDPRGMFDDDDEDEEPKRTRAKAEIPAETTPAAETAPAAEKPEPKPAPAAATTAVADKPERESA